MIFGYRIYISAHVCTQNSTTVPNICDIAHLVDYQDDYCTAAASLDWILRLSIAKKFLFCFFEAKFESFDWLVREVRVLSDLYSM